MSDFNLALDLGFLTKNRKYTFFKPYYIILATYLSEKVCCALCAARLVCVCVPARARVCVAGCVWLFARRALIAPRTKHTHTHTLTHTTPPTHNTPHRTDRLLALHQHLPPPAAQPRQPALPALRVL